MTNDETPKHEGMTNAESRKPEFTCRRCGACCRWDGHVWVTSAEADAIAARLGLAPEAFIERYTELTRNRRGLSLHSQPDGACVFLEGSDCRIYPVRPAQCREFPVTWSVPGCPGVTEQ